VKELISYEKFGGEGKNLSKRKPQIKIKIKLKGGITSCLAIR